MKNFSFKFERLLSIKEYNERKAQIEFSAVLQKRLSYQRANEIMKNEILSINENSYDDTGNNNLLNVDNIMIQSKVIKGMEAQIKDNDRKFIELQGEYDEKYKKLSEAMKEKKILEKLKEKDFKQFKKDFHKEETKILDEIGNIAFTRNKEKVW